MMHRHGWMVLVVAAAACGGCVTEERQRPTEPVAAAPSADEIAAQKAAALSIAQSAQALARDGNIDGAIEKYRLALMTYRDYGDAWNNLGQLLSEKRENMAAAEAFTYASELSPDDPRPLANIGALWERQRYYAKGAEYYDKALQRDPSYLDALRGFIRCSELMDVRTQVLAERIQTALLLERDPAWHAYFQRQKIVTEGILKDRPGSVTNPMGR